MAEGSCFIQPAWTFCRKVEKNSVAPWLLRCVKNKDKTDLIEWVNKMIENESVHFRQEITCHSSNGYRSVVCGFCAGNFSLCWFYCLDTGSAKRIICSLFICLFFYPDNVWFILSMNKCCLHILGVGRKQGTKNSYMLHNYIQTENILHRGASKCRHESLMQPFMKSASM